MINIQEIKKSSHILLITDNKTFANASAIYSYILTLHKKVSIYKKESLDRNLSFLPWYDKCREKAPSSAEYIIEVQSNTETLFTLFKEHKININSKMATALYASLLQEYDGFQSDICNGTIFAMSSELILLGAEYKKCNDFILRRVSLATFRLKAILYQNMRLKDEAKVALLEIRDDDLKSSGAVLGDAYRIMKEVLTVVNVEEVKLIKLDENNKILKIIKG